MLHIYSKIEAKLSNCFLGGLLFLLLAGVMPWDDGTLTIIMALVCRLFRGGAMGYRGVSYGHGFCLLAPSGSCHGFCLLAPSGSCHGISRR